MLRIDGNEITGIEEKPTYVHPASAGIYCLSGDAVRLVPDDTALTMPELAMRVRGEGGKVLAYEIHEFWRALETRDHFEELLNDERTLATLAENLPDGG